MKDYERRFDSMDIDAFSRNKMELLQRNRPTEWRAALKAVVDQDMSRDEAREYIGKAYLAVSPRLPDIDIDDQHREEARAIIRAIADPDSRH